VLVAPSNTLADLQPLMPIVLENLSVAKRSEALVLGGGESRLTND